MTEDFDLYHVLHVHSDASLKMIRSAYKLRLRDAHPDHGGSHEETTRINDAYEVLSDPAKRANYDSQRKAARERTKPHEMGGSELAAEIARLKAEQERNQHAKTVALHQLRQRYESMTAEFASRLKQAAALLAGNGVPQQSTQTTVVATLPYEIPYITFFRVRTTTDTFHVLGQLPAGWDLYLQTVLVRPTYLGRLDVAGELWDLPGTQEAQQAFEDAGRQPFNEPLPAVRQQIPEFDPEQVHWWSDWQPCGLNYSSQIPTGHLAIGWRAAFNKQPERLVLFGIEGEIPLLEALTGAVATMLERETH